VSVGNAVVGYPRSGGGSARGVGMANEDSESEAIVTCQKPIFARLLSGILDCLASHETVTELMANLPDNIR
jgi:hypothetical protein